MSHKPFDFDEYLKEKAERVRDNTIRFARLAKAVRQAPDLVRSGKQGRNQVDIIEDEDEDEDEDSLD